MSRERWKAVEHRDFSMYKVSDHGRVFSKRCKKILSSSTTNGYPSVDLYADGKKHKVYIHRLVALAFIPIDCKRKCVNHKDGDKTNNHFKNLEWVTREENTKHAWETGLCKPTNNSNPVKGESHYNCKLSCLNVEEIKALIQQGEKLSHISKLFNVSTMQISRIKSGKTRREG